MATYWPHSRIPLVDPSGDPRSGAKAYFFEESTTTPYTVYTDSGENISHDHPVVADATGAFPAIFIPDGTYRVRVTDADGVTLWDDDGIVALSSASGGTTVTDTAIDTGDLVFAYKGGTRNGWVRANGRTIGSASSGATERANADTQSLFEHLWGADATLAVSGGRGATAAGDYAANKRITLPDMRDRVPIGLGAMGNSLIGRIPTSIIPSPDTLGTAGGVGEITLSTDQIPSHTHSSSPHSHTVNDPGHRHTLDSRGGVDGSVGAFIDTAANAGNSFATTLIDIAATGITLSSTSVTTNSTGGGSSHANVQPGLKATWYIKL